MPQASGLPVTGLSPSATAPSSTWPVDVGEATAGGIRPTPAGAPESRQLHRFSGWSGSFH